MCWKSGRESQVCAAYTIPYTREDMKAFLQPTAFLQSTDKTLVEKAQEIVGGERDALKAVTRIKEWVYRTIEKKPTLRFPVRLMCYG